MKKLIATLFLTATIGILTATAQTVTPTAYYTDEEGVQQSTTSSVDKVQAPLDVTFRANPEKMEEYSPSYEWHFKKKGEDGEYEELFVRYEENTQYTFYDSGTYNIILKYRLEQDDVQQEASPLVITIPDSKLIFPNAFSPNGDEFNQIYRAKEYKSIVSFHAVIINRWGQRLYEWDDPAGGWDGTYKGRDVKEGVYFVIVNAKGADGHEYKIRKDVNLLRGIIEGETSGGSTK